MKSPEICRELGAYLLERFPHLRVDVHNPKVTVMVEIRDFDPYINGNQQTGAGGMPSASAALAAMLISGGIDSPLAGYLMARRGLALVGVHFASPPYTSERARQKVVALCRRLALYTGRISLATVPFTDIQQQIAQKCPEEYSTLIMRRFMMELAGVLAGEKGCGALITGESLGQVASQTLPAIACTDAAARLPVFRPVIGLDKEDIVAVRPSHRDF
jgi:thiamine biosynthesis protein ThiI